MTAPQRYGLRSLRLKLVLASVVVEALMLTALVWNSTRIAGESIQELLQHRVEVLVPLMNVSLANPLAQRDYATLDERLGRIVRKESLVYIEVRDELGRIAASRGDLPAVPHLDRSIESARDVSDQEFDITVAGRVIGRARYGLNVSLLEATLASLRNQGVLVASAGIVLSVLLLATLGALLTRRLLTLAHAAGTLAGGDYTVRLPAPPGRDEIADVARAFNAMASALERDIAERRRAEAALRESEERFRATFEQAAVGIAQVTPDGRWLQVNQKLCDIVGYRREELLQRTFQDITHPDDLDADLAFVRRMLAGEIQTYDMEKRYLRKDGSLIWIYLTVGLVRQPTGEPKYFISVVEDISERKQAEAKLHESEERLRLALDAAHMGTFDWDVPHNRTTWSRWHEELWGFQPGEFGGTYEAFSQRLHPGDLPRIDAEVARCIAAREPFVREFRVVWPDGSTHWIASHGEFTFDADGQPSRMHGVVREITALKRAEILLSGEKKVLEMMAEGAPLSTILETITRNVEADSNDTLCSILLLDAANGRLQHGAAPSLPESYNRAIHGLAIGPKVGSCGTAVYRNQPVIVTDIATDPLWDDYRALALPHGLRACWSTPIRSAGGQVLGSFALYYRAPRAPGPADFELIARVTHLSAIAIERRRAEQALQVSEERLRLALDAAHLGTFDWDVPRNRIAWSRWHEELWGFEPGEFGGTYEAFSARVHPDDLPGIDAEVTRCIAAREPFVREFRVVWPDGSTHWIASHGEFTFDAENQPLHMRGAVMEITERKQAEEALRENALQLQMLSKRVIEAQETERRRLAGELHDELGQALTAIKINLQARGRFKGQSPEVLDAENIRIVDDALQQVRRLALALRPSMLDDLGLGSALRWMADQQAERGGFAVHFGADFPDTRLAPELETACFRIAQEALTNIARHAQAKRVAIELRHADDVLVMTMQDDGCGFDVAAMRARATAGVSIGLLGMQERATLAGGSLDIESSPKRGTILRARFPWRTREEQL